ncbi:hypothetical protein [Streptomyces antibioticus]|uniref:hypothetical protein n=1 Tax=Streptomyces antibioticus TaxID=1890 RepID=UPI0019606025|nr:hypothetical protein [Streptomyces sp. S9]
MSSKSWDCTQRGELLAAYGENERPLTPHRPEVGDRLGRALLVLTNREVAR